MSAAAAAASSPPSTLSFDFSKSLVRLAKAFATVEQARTLEESVKAATCVDEAIPGITLVSLSKIADQLFQSKGVESFFFFCLHLVDSREDISSHVEMVNRVSLEILNSETEKILPYRDQLKIAHQAIRIRAAVKRNWLMHLSLTL